MGGITNMKYRASLLTKPDFNHEKKYVYFVPNMTNRDENSIGW